MWFYHHI
ncbi:hypothetical protein AVEN_195604-1, partial [Araneus ventricosus]